MTTNEVATRAGLSESQIRALISEGRLTRAGRNKFDPATAGWEIADYWRARVARANPGESVFSDEAMASLLKQLMEEAEPYTREPGKGIPD